MKQLELWALSVLAVFAPIKAIMIVAGVLVFADLITGMWAAHKRKEAITSAGIRRTVTKTAVYLSSIMLGYLVEKYMIEGLLPVSKIIAGLIGIVEFKSILENFNVIHGGDIFKSLIEKLGSINDTKKDGDS